MPFVVLMLFFYHFLLLWCYFDICLSFASIFLIWYRLNSSASLATIFACQSQPFVSFQVFYHNETCKGITPLSNVLFHFSVHPISLTTRKLGLFIFTTSVADGANGVVKNVMKQIGLQPRSMLLEIARSFNGKLCGCWFHSDNFFETSSFDQG